MPSAATDAIAQIPSWVEAAKDISLVGWLIISIYMLTTRKWVTQATYDEKRADDTRELTERVAYVEARRIEERDGRIAAERRVSELTERWDRALGIMANIERELIRAVTRDRS